ncbi:hypothetical protein SLEP1_g23021 [Rubroshorea leprosula]|uniref:Uncharacterized protein n=1 Tax=Rubroshorea leprosula TaxID=152421 RepID=A0AAV5JN35_9ROSI|nr:hypothetical protein SLEP1_g23021 [Rubroshorea leprosula]
MCFSIYQLLICPPVIQLESLPNQELRQIISQLNLEASVYHHNTTSSCSCGRTIGIVSVDSEFEDVEREL